MSAWILIETLLARQAAINATGYHIDELERCLVAQREAVTWRQYENADNRLHRTIAWLLETVFVGTFWSIECTMQLFEGPKSNRRAAQGSFQFCTTWRDCSSIRKKDRERCLNNENTPLGGQDGLIRQNRMIEIQSEICWNVSYRTKLTA